MTLKEKKTLEHYLNTNKKSEFYNCVEQHCPINGNPSAKLYVMRKVYFLEIKRENKEGRRTRREGRQKEGERSRERLRKKCEFWSFGSSLATHGFVTLIVSLPK